MFLLVIFGLFTLGREINGATHPMPVVLPPYNTSEASPTSAQASWGSCLFYMESLVVTVFSVETKEPSSLSAVIGSANNSYTFSNDYVNCLQGERKGQQAQNFTFKVDLSLKSPAQAVYDQKTLFSVAGPITVTLKFSTTPGYGWELSEVVADKLTIKKESDPWLSSDLTVDGGRATPTSISQINVGSFSDYNYGCSSTRYALFDTKDKKYLVGVALGNVQIQAFGAITSDKQAVRFSTRTNDCIGTFNAGSWMGIIVAIVLASVLMFGFLMLNSVQTIDRYDDPKQKQLIINAKD